jgi:hypothetical protein
MLDGKIAKCHSRREVQTGLIAGPELRACGDNTRRVKAGDWPSPLMNDLRVLVS